MTRTPIGSMYSASVGSPPNSEAPDALWPMRPRYATPAPKRVNGPDTALKRLVPDTERSTPDPTCLPTNASTIVNGAWFNSLL